MIRAISVWKNKTKRTTLMYTFIGQKAATCDGVDVVVFSSFVPRYDVTQGNTIETFTDQTPPETKYEALIWR